MIRNFLILLCLFGSAMGAAQADCTPGQQEQVSVASVALNGDLTLADGRIVRLAGVAWPRSKPARQRVVAEVSAAVLHERVVLKDVAGPDRWRRHAAQVFIAQPSGKDPAWVQGQLIEDGVLEAWPEPAARPCWAALTERLMLARTGQLGLWSALGRRQLKRFGAKAHSALPDFVLYEGVVRSVRKGRSMTFVNFVGQRGRTPSLFLPGKMIAALRQHGRDAATFTGKRIRVWATVGPGTPARLSIASADGLEVLE
jgi:hypothetical protein